MGELSRPSDRRWTAKEVREIAFLAAGAGAGCVMAEAPSVTMPTERITATVAILLDDAGVPRDG